MRFPTRLASKDMKNSNKGITSLEEIAHYSTKKNLMKL